MNGNVRQTEESNLKCKQQIKQY